MRIAVIGASANPDKFGHKAVRAYLAQGHEVIPVHPSEEEILGQTVSASIGAIAGALDRVSVYLPPAIGIAFVEELAGHLEQTGHPVPELWLNPGAESAELIARAKSLGFEPIVACSIVDIGERP